MTFRGGLRLKTLNKYKINMFIMVFFHFSVGGACAASVGNVDTALFDKDFECSVCLDDLKPPVKIFQCRNGHVMCESCKNHPEVITCPTCRIPLPGADALMRNIPMEKLARSYFEKMDAFVCRSRSANRSRRASIDQ